MIALRPSPDLTRSTEDYLKAIYELEARAGAAQTTAIAVALELTPPSVSSMVKRLSELGLVEHVPYRGVQLTDTGRLAALRMLRRHRIIESFLAVQLGYDWDSVHEEADRLEHAVSDALIERMAMVLGNPRYDPHGAPIPTTSGEIEEPECVPLTQLSVGALAEVKMVSDKDPERLRFIGSLGVKPGAVFEVLARQPFNGPFTIRIEGVAPREQVVGYELGKSLHCALVQKEAE